MFQTIPRRVGFQLVIWVFSPTVTVIEEGCVITSIVDFIIKH